MNTIIFKIIVAGLLVSSGYYIHGLVIVFYAQEQDIIVVVPKPVKKVVKPMPLMEQMRYNRYQTINLKLERTGKLELYEGLTLHKLDPYYAEMDTLKLKRLKFYFQEDGF